MTLPASYAALIASDRVSTQTRDALLSRLGSDARDYRPRALTAAAYRTLEAMLARILPQDRIDLAQRIDRALAGGEGDGWRFADLPPDPAAMQQALDALAAFSTLSIGAQDSLLAAVASGAHGQPRQRWFEDLRGTATRLYVADPTTMARIGYGGIAYGGDHPEHEGFDLLEPGQRAAWEPEPQR